MHYVPLDLCGKRCRDGRRNEDEVIKAYYVGTKQLVGLCYDLNLQGPAPDSCFLFCQKCLFAELPGTKNLYSQIRVTILPDQGKKGSKNIQKVLAITFRSSNLARYTEKSKMKLAGGGPNFARFAKSGAEIVNLATLFVR